MGQQEQIIPRTRSHFFGLKMVFKHKFYFFFGYLYVQKKNDYNVEDLVAFSP